MILDAITPKQPRLLVADLDGTLLHDAEVFEDRFITQRSIDTINRAHDAGMQFAIATARPVSTGLQFAEKLPVDAVIYLNGALIDFDPAHSDFDLLTSGATPADENHLIKIGFSSRRACEVCLFLLDRMPGLKLGIVMNDVRYTNFDVRVYWKTQAFQYTNFHDVPEGVADKITIFPEPEQWNELRALIPPDFDISISEGVMWMLMNPQANKEHALHLLCERLDVPLEQTAAFGRRPHRYQHDERIRPGRGRGQREPQGVVRRRRDLPVQQRGRRRQWLKRSWVNRSRLENTPN